MINPTSGKEPSVLMALGVLIGLSLNAAATPGNFSFAGSFSADDDVQLFSFTVNGSAAVRLISYSYGGGTQANGTVVARGGFDPILALFDASGLLVGENDDAGSALTGACGSGLVTPDAVTNEEWDTCLELTLAAGAYQAAVMQYNNFALGPKLSDGFSYTRSPTFTADAGCTNGRFCDVSDVAAGNNRSERWALDILNVERATLIPEPAPFAYLTLGLAGVAFHRRRTSI